MDEQLIHKLVKEELSKTACIEIFEDDLQYDDSIYEKINEEVVDVSSLFVSESVQSALSMKTSLGSISGEASSFFNNFTTKLAVGAVATAYKSKDAIAAKAGELGSDFRVSDNPVVSSVRDALVSLGVVSKQTTAEKALTALASIKTFVAGLGWVPYALGAIATIAVGVLAYKAIFGDKTNKAVAAALKDLEANVKKRDAYIIDTLNEADPVKRGKKLVKNEKIISKLTMDQAKLSKKLEDSLKDKNTNLDDKGRKQIEDLVKASKEGKLTYIK